MAEKKGGGSMPKQTGTGSKTPGPAGKDTPVAKPGPKGGKK